MTTTSRVRFTVLTLGLAVGVSLGSRPVAGQDKPFVRITEAQTRAAAATAIAAAKGNDLTFSNTIQKELRKIANDYTNNSFKVYERAELIVTVQGPAQYLAASATYRLKLSQPVEPLSWPGGITVNVQPLNENAQDVVKVVVTRDGKEITPTAVNLDMIDVSAASGGGRAQTKRMAHSGSVTFPVDAFNPGAKVEVSAVLDSGRKLSRTLADSDLVKVQ